MAGFGTIIGQPGYRGPTSRIRGRTPPQPASGRSGGGGSGAFGGSFGMPSYRPSAARQSGSSTPSTAPSTASFGMPQAQQYTPGTYGAQTYEDPNLDVMAGFGKGLMDPESDYYKRLSAGMQRQIGAQSEAQQRAAALRGAWGGMGGGQGGEVMRTAADIGQAGLEAQGVAEADLRLQGPMAGAQMLGSTFGPQLGYHQLTEGGRQFGAGFGEQSRQFGAGLGEQARQFGVGVGLQQQGMAQQAAQFQAQMDMERQRMEWERMMREMEQLYA